MSDKPAPRIMDKAALERALDNVDVARLAEGDGVKLSPPHNGQRSGRCPRAPGRCSSQTDSFRVSRRGNRERWFCRKCADPKAEHQGGDGLAYLREVRGLTFTQAVEELERLTGITIYQPRGETRDGASGGFSLQGKLPGSSEPRQVVRALVDPELGLELPDELAEPPADAWQKVARAFVDECSRLLWQPRAAKALGYLYGERMLSGPTIQTYKLGVNAERRELAPGVWARPGYVIPHFYAGHLWRVRIRRFEHETNPRELEHKYKLLSGAGENKGQLFNADALEQHPGGDVVLCGGEFDALVLQQAAPPGVVCLTFGSETQRPTWEAVWLMRDRRVFVAFDTDEAGASGAARWLEAIPRARIIAPTAHDITDMARAGVDVGAWLRMHLEGVRA